MNDLNENKSLGSLLQNLREREQVSASNQEIADHLLGQNNRSELVIYAQLLVGIGAFIASFSFVLFVVLSLKLDDAASFMLSAFVLGVISVTIQKLSSGSGSIKDHFYLQASFALMAAASILFAIGMVNLLGSGWAVSLALLISTAAGFWSYTISAQSFLATTAILGSALVNILWGEQLPVSREIVFNAYLFIQMVAFAGLIAYGQLKYRHTPILYGLLCSICLCALALATQQNFGNWNSKQLISSLYAKLFFGAALITTIIWVAGGIATAVKSQEHIVAILGSALLGVICEPGVTLTIILMIIGYAHHARAITATGIILVPLFLWLFYYNLDVSLLKKSGILAFSGLILLAACFYLRLRGYTTENRP